MNEVTGILEIADDGTGIPFDGWEKSFIGFINCIVLPMPAVATLAYLSSVKSSGGMVEKWKPCLVVREKSSDQSFILTRYLRVKRQPLAVFFDFF